MRRLIAAIALCLVAVACDVGYAILVENQTDQDYVVRFAGQTFTDKAQWVPGEIVTIAPANSKRVAYQVPFRGGLEPRRLDVLREDCTPLFSANFDQLDGGYILIDDDAKVSIRKEFPQKGDPAPPTDLCRTIPVASPSPS